MKAPVVLLAPAALGLVVLGACFGVGMTQGLSYSQPATSGEEPIVVVEETPTPTPIPTESALVVPTPTPLPEVASEPVAEEAAPEKGPSEEPVAEEATPGPWVQPCTSWLADHGGICRGEPVDWEFSHGETLVCGHDAKPALDYREDVGWWAYCEPALVP